MKTLSEAVQLQVIDQAGSTFRNIILAQMKEYGVAKQCVDNARHASQVFIDLIVNNVNQKENIDTPEVDFDNIQEVNRGS